MDAALGWLDILELNPSTACTPSPCWPYHTSIPFPSCCPARPQPQWWGFLWILEIFTRFAGNVLQQVRISLSLAWIEEAKACQFIQLQLTCSSECCLETLSWPSCTDLHLQFQPPHYLYTKYLFNCISRADRKKYSLEESLLRNWRSTSSLKQ